MASRVPKICQKQKKMNSLYYLKKAKQACSENNYAVAYEYFVNYFESLNDPSQSSTTVQAAFTKLVCKIGSVLEETDNIEELLKCYLQAINFFPNNYIILNNLGAYMFKVGEMDIARRYLELAVKINKDYLPAERNLMHVKWHQIPRWHFRMLNDKQRNIAYDKAITDAMVKGYNNIVDIGAGCGLLSLLASRNVEANITAIEENKNLYKICLDVLKENNTTNVNLLNCYSTDLTNPPYKCNLLVTEIFDVALFGERALESILHALTVLRTEEDFKIIPCKAKVYVTGINSEELARKYWYIPDTESPQVLNLENMYIKHCKAEPYEAEHLAEVNVEYVTETQEVFNINFYDQDYICQLLRDECHKVVDLKCKQGVIHALAVWFELYLSEDEYITTNPLDKNCVKCWEQAVFYLDHPVYMNEGGTLSLKVSVEDCKLTFQNANEHYNHHECFEVSKDIISFISDKKLVESMVNLAEKINSDNLTIVDYNIFPLFGFLVAKKNNTVYHTLKNGMDIDFFKHILTINNIPLEKFVILDQKISLSTNTGLQPSIYFSDVICTDGSLENVSKEKNELSATIRIPQTINVNVQLIFSSYIDHCNKVEDENVLGFKIAKFINEYSGNEHPNLENFPYAEFSSPVRFLLEGDGKKSSQVVVTNSGIVNSMLFWYDVQLYEEVTFSTLMSSHFKQSCFFLQEPKTVTAGDTYEIVMKTEGPYLKLSLD